MTRDEYLHVLATEPATSTQVGAIIGEFTRLGVTGRAERLAISAGLLGLDHLASTKDLVRGDAGRLYRMLLDVRDRAELPGIPAAGDGEDQAGEHGEQISIAEALRQIALAIYLACQGRPALARKSEIFASKLPTWRAGRVFLIWRISEAVVWIRANGDQNARGAELDGRLPAPRARGV
jgi:hypothetical protein